MMVWCGGCRARCGYFALSEERRFGGHASEEPCRDPGTLCRGVGWRRWWHREGGFIEYRCYSGWILGGPWSCWLLLLWRGCRLRYRSKRGTLFKDWCLLIVLKDSIALHALSLNLLSFFKVCPQPQTLLTRSSVYGWWFRDHGFRRVSAQGNCGRGAWKSRIKSVKEILGAL